MKQGTMDHDIADRDVTDRGKPKKASDVRDIKLAVALGLVKDKLLSGEFESRLDHPLAFWSLPRDRRLPLAFMGRTLRHLLDTPFEVLHDTPGIGQKKLETMLVLFERATAPTAPGASLVAPLEPSPDEDELPPGSEGFQVSEALWSEWQVKIRDHGLEGEPMGRFAPSLQSIPRVMWRTPLSMYLGLTLQEIRSLKTHGEKRINAILEVCGALDRVLPAVDSTHFSVRLMSRPVARADQWVNAQLNAAEPSPENVGSGFLAPLLEQLRTDAGDEMADIVAAKLGVGEKKESVRVMARRMKLTRARVYQLIADMAEMIDVRWPVGVEFVNRLLLQVTGPARSNRWMLFEAAARMLFEANASRAEDESPESVQFVSGKRHAG